MPIEMRFLIDVILFLIILGWGTLYGFIQSYTKLIDKNLKDE